MSRRIGNANADNQQTRYKNTSKRNKSSNRPQLKHDRPDRSNQPKLKSQVNLQPKNLAQETYIDSLQDPNTTVVFAVGAAGTGKTMLATVHAIDQLKSNEIKKIIITRPAVSVEEQHGFLPGSLIDKMQPWVLPILDYFYEYYGKKELLGMIEADIVEIAPLSYMRGRTFKHCIIIADEMQNATPNQMKMLLTRIGEGCQIVVTGDMEQHDRGYEDNGLKDFISRYTGQAGITVCKFGKKDIERHPLIDTILGIYD